MPAASSNRKRGRPAASTSNSSPSKSQPENPVVFGSNQAESKFITASSGDLYLINASANTKTSDHLLSDLIDPAFTFTTYADSLAEFDVGSSNPQMVKHRQRWEEHNESHDAKFFRWQHEMEQGFNILLYGFGSKIKVVDRFAHEMSRKGNVIVVKGYDGTVSLVDIVEVLESFVKFEAREDEDEDNAGGSPSKRSKGKGKQKERIPVSAVGVVEVSAIEGRVRRVCSRMKVAQGDNRKDVYLLIHSLDGPVLRQAKTLSLLALLAAQPRIHLLATVDHIRAALLFPITLASARPNNSKGAAHDDDLETRAFTFVYHEVTTLEHYSTEVDATSVLSRLLPPAIFPRSTLSTNDTSASIAQSAHHVLQSVGDRSRRLFTLVAELQIEALDALSSSAARNLLLTPTITSPVPCIAILSTRVKSKARDDLIASSDEQVDALWMEFMDHGVFRSGTIAPVGVEVDDSRGVWIWIPLGKDELAETLEQIEEMGK